MAPTDHGEVARAMAVMTRAGGGSMTARQGLGRTG
jgi:hypothetical protein